METAHSPNLLPLQRELILERVGFMALHGSAVDSSVPEHGPLREHQNDALEDLRIWLNEPWPEEGKAGFVHMATGSGKTATFVEFIRSLSDSNGKPPKTLVLVPKVSLLHQTIGDPVTGEKGFEQFAPELEVTSYYEKNKDLSGDVVVMTYASFNMACKLPLLQNNFPVVICDEAHRTLGKIVEANLREYKKGRLTIGFSATPDFSEEKQLSRLLPDKIHELDIDAAMEKGIIMRPQAWAYATEATVTAKYKESTDYTEDELAHLVNIESRNQAAILFLKEFVEQGLQGAVTTIPGKDAIGMPLAHARKLHAAAQQELVTDFYTKERRYLRTAVVGGHMKEEDLDRFYEQLRKGEIDALFGVDLLNEGFDAPNLKFLINTRPTKSAVVCKQRAGRTLRLAERTPQIVEFIDRSNVGQMTIFNILGVTKLDQGAVIGPKPLRETHPAEETPHVVTGATGYKNKVDLSTDIHHLIDGINLIKIDELLPHSAEVEATPEGYLTAYGLEKITGVGWLTIQKVVRELGIEPVERTNQGSGWKTLKYFSPEQVEHITMHPLITTAVAPENYLSAGAVTREYGLDRSVFINAANELGIVPLIAKDNRGRIKNFYSPEQVEAVSKLPIFTLSAPPDDYENASQLHQRLRVGYDLVSKLIDELGLQGTVYKQPKTGLITVYFSREEVERLMQHPDLNVPYKEDDSYSTLTELAKEFKTSSPRIKRVAQEINLTYTVLKNPKNGRIRDYVSTEEQVRLRNALGAD